MGTATRWAIAATFIATLGAGCLFHDTPATRYFVPPSALGASDDPPADAPLAQRPVRLRRVRAATYLGEQIVWRASDVERGLYEQRRWTEFPSRYVERAMLRALDRTPGIRRVESGSVPILDLELVSFDEVLAPSHEADVGIIAILRNADQVPIFEQAFTARQPIAQPDPAATARAIGAALDDVVTQIAAQVAARAPAPPKAKNR
jgi:ABC-type uncharacterized transport system auxiliary subunit